VNQKHNFTTPVIGTPKISSPIMLSNKIGDSSANYVRDDQLIIYDIVAKPGKECVYQKSDLLELAGPREKIFFDPAKVHAAIVTCGGLCPGLNDVIHSLVMCLWHNYGVRNISGIRFGYRGFLPEYHIPIMELTPKIVTDIHTQGGTVLGSSRGKGDKTNEIVDALERMNISMLFTIGGDGTQKGALRIAEEIEKRGLKIAVVGIPKTIDNDLSFIERSFGFETAVSRAADAVSNAHVEAHDSINGVGIVKVMGRQAGFIAANTALASGDVNFVLIPESPFDLDGAKGLLVQLKKRLAERNHAVILVAEGAGQDLMADTLQTDASGNKKLGDIGTFLRDKIADYFKGEIMEANIKYIDPSYMIRSAPANPNDGI
jgi:6-phosphofructokinase 1